MWVKHGKTISYTIPQITIFIGGINPSKKGGLWHCFTHISDEIMGQLGQFLHINSVFSYMFPWFSMISQIHGIVLLVGGIPTPLKNMSSSVGMMKFPII